MSVLEVLFKIILTIIVLFFVLWIWSHQIDPVRTVTRFFKNKSQEKVDWIATRDANAIYQKGEIVGKVFGQVKETNDKIVFSQLYDTSKLIKEEIFEYRRFKLIITKIGSITGLDINMIDGTTEVRNNVLKNVECLIKK